MQHTYTGANKNQVENLIENQIANQNALWEDETSHLDAA